jgi:hypothetical protein
MLNAALWAPVFWPPKEEYTGIRISVAVLLLCAKLTREVQRCGFERNSSFFDSAFPKRKEEDDGKKKGEGFKEIGVSESRS